MAGRRRIRNLVYREVYERLYREHANPARLGFLSLGLKRHANQYFVRDALNPSPPLAFEEANEHLLRLCRIADARVPRETRERCEQEWRRRAESAIGSRYAKSNALTAYLIDADLRALGYNCG